MKNPATAGATAQAASRTSVGDAGSARALLGSHHRHHVGLAGRHVHLDEPLAQQEQDRRHREARRERHR